MNETPTPSPRVLIVDDEPSIRNAMQRWLSSHGFDADTASNGVEALDLFRKNTYDIVTMDLDMPRMDGRETIRKLRSISPDQPIIMITGYLDRVDDALLQSVSRILLKPISLRRIEQEIREVLGRPIAVPHPGDRAR